MNFLVYKITNSINSKIYIGATQQELKKRWQQHKCNANKKNYHLYNAMFKYGFENFNIEVVFKADSKDAMYKKEMQLISEYESNNRLFGYNNSKGGEYSRYGCKLTIEQRKKISIYQKNRKRNPHSEETKLKMSISAKGKDMSKAVENSAKARKGKPAKNRLKVDMYTKDGVLVKKFNSYTEASIYVNGHISAFKALKTGRLKTYKNHIWKFNS